MKGCNIMDNNQYPGQQGNPNQSYPQPNQQFGQGYPQQPNQQYNQGYPQQPNQQPNQNQQYYQNPGQGYPQQPNQQYSQGYPQQPNQQYNQGYNQQYNQGYQQPLYNQPPKKNNTNRTVLIIILIVLGVFILLSVIIGVGIYMAIERESSTENDTSITFEEYTISNTTEATTESTTSSITEDETTEETTEESTEDTSSTAAEVDYSGKYTPDYEVDRKGDSTTGYIDVPANWSNWTEAGASWENVIGHQQYSYGVTDVITHVTYDENIFALDLETTLNNMTSSDAESKVESARFGDYTGYLMTEKFTDGITLRIFMFNDGKGHVQYLAVEGIDDDYADVYKLVFQNFSFDK